MSSLSFKFNDNSSKLNIEEQISIFNFVDSFTKTTEGKNYSCEPVLLTKEIIQKFEVYDVEKYTDDIKNYGLENTWNYICQYIIDKNDNEVEILNIDNLCELYEIGLAIQDKIQKKKHGQYGTPKDVAIVMAQWLNECDGDAVCDVACGTGRLILSYLDLIGYEKARELISNGKLYLYDSDNVALKICRTTIAKKYGLDIADSINDVFCDFLDRSVKLPDNCKVISNPPYAKIETLQDYWEDTQVLLDTKEFYSAFMEKIVAQAKSSVIITPFTFISGAKYYSLRKLMCEKGHGFIVAFDNVPGNIFYGKKHGVFNTNTSNSVRAAITVTSGDNTKKGYRVSPLIRFKNAERKQLLKNSVLEKTLPNNYQIITQDNKAFRKIDKSLESVFQSWISKSDYTVSDLISKNNTDFLIDIPNTCRYFTTASSKKLSRTGSIVMYVKNEEMFNFLYCFVNSSFAYWWWRIYDGGITYPVNLLHSMPVPYNLLTPDDKEFFSLMTQKLMESEKFFVITKMNAGAPQQNIKFPESYRTEINARILKILGINLNGEAFNVIHTNRFFNDEE